MAKFRDHTAHFQFDERLAAENSQYPGYAFIIH
jgi:hypothetical protein